MCRYKVNKGNYTTVIRLFVSIFCLATFFISLEQVAQTQIHWGTDEWPEITNSNGTGLYHELMQEIYPQQEFEMTISYYPWRRVRANLEHKQIDMTGAMPEAPDYYQSSQPVLSQKIVLVVDKNKSAKFDIDNLRNYRGSWRKGYEEDIVYHVVPPPLMGTYIEDTKQALDFLLYDKVDYYIDIEDVINRELGENKEQFEIIQVGYFNLYWTFVATNKGMELKHQFDQKWLALMASEFIEKLYKKYNMSLPQKVDKLVCGVAENYPPYQFIGKRKKVNGFDADLFRELFKTTNKELTFVQVPNTDLVSILTTNSSLDCVIGAELDQEQDGLDFSIPYYKRNLTLFTLSSNLRVNKLEDLKTLRVAGKDLSPSFTGMLQDNDLLSTVELKQTESIEESFRLLKSKQYAAIIAPKEVGLYFAKKFSIPVKVIVEIEAEKPVAIAVKKGNPKLIELINNLLSKSISSDRIEQIYKKWFGYPLTSE